MSFRDQYVTFHEENLSRSPNQFAICDDTICDYHKVPYDCGSIMHYPADTYAYRSGECSESDKSGCTLTGKTDECQKLLLARRNGDLSENDIKHLHYLYPCPQKCNVRCEGLSPDRSCFCDFQCRRYGDCCPDYNC